MSDQKQTKTPQRKRTDPRPFPAEAPVKQSAEEKGELGPREEVFIEEYLVDLNPYRAAKAAGYFGEHGTIQGVPMGEKP